MRKIFILVLAALMLITALFGCNNQPVPTPNDDTQVQQPETTNPGTTPGGVTNPPSGDTGDTVEYEKTSTYEVGDGQFVFKESKYEYDGNNLVIMNVKNKTSQNYTLTIHYTCYDESGAEVLSETRKYDGFAANYSQNILLLPMKPFDTYSYTIETAPYSGVCFGAKHSLEWVGLAEDISDIKGDMYPSLVGQIKENNQNTEAFFRTATIILFNNTGEIRKIYPFETTRLEMQKIDAIHYTAFIAYQHTEGEMVWPDELTGELTCVIIPYYATNRVDVYWDSDKPKIWPNPTMEPREN